MLKIEERLHKMKLTLDGKEWTGEALSREHFQLRNWLTSNGVGQDAVLLLPGLTNGTLAFLVPAVIALNATIALTPPLNASEALSFARLSGAEWLCAEQEFSTEELSALAQYEIAGTLLRLYRIVQPVQRPFTGNGAVYFTSGTTAASRAVFREWQKLFAEVEAYQRHLNLHPEAEIAAMVPLFHSYGFGSALINALSLGAHLHGTNQLLPASLRRLLQRNRYDLALVSPQTLWLCTQTCAGAEKICVVDRVISSGGPLSTEGAQAAKKVLGWEVRQQYGSSETGAISVDQWAHSDPATVGQPLPGVSVTINTCGEIEVISPYAAAGYLQDNARGKFVGGIFRLGDCGYFNLAGDLFLTGRIDDEATIAGKRIRLQELQHFLQALPGVELARVRKKRSGEELSSLQIELYGAIKISQEDVLAALTGRFGTFPLQIRFCKPEDAMLTGVVK